MERAGWRLLRDVALCDDLDQGVRQRVVAKLDGLLDEFQRGLVEARRRVATWIRDCLRPAMDETTSPSDARSQAIRAVYLGIERDLHPRMLATEENELAGLRAAAKGHPGGVRFDQVREALLRDGVAREDLTREILSGIVGKDSGLFTRRDGRITWDDSRAFDRAATPLQEKWRRHGRKGQKRITHDELEERGQELEARRESESDRERALIAGKLGEVLDQFDRECDERARSEADAATALRAAFRAENWRQSPTCWRSSKGTRAGLSAA